MSKEIKAVEEGHLPNDLSLVMPSVELPISEAFEHLKFFGARLNALELRNPPMVLAKHIDES